MDQEQPITNLEQIEHSYTSPKKIKELQKEILKIHLVKHYHRPKQIMDHTDHERSSVSPFVYISTYLTFKTLPLYK